MTEDEETPPLTSDPAVPAVVIKHDVTDTAEWFITPDGARELVDKATGQVLLREEKKKRADRWDRVVPRSQSRESKHKRQVPDQKHRYIHDAKGKLIWVPTDVHPDVFRAKYPKSQATFDVICKLVSQGKSLKQVSRRKGMPPVHVLYQWIQDPDFRPLWLKAKNGRGEAAADVVVELATAPPVMKDEAAGARVKMEAAKWVAETGNREDYGRSTKITGDPNAPLAILIDTGIRREPIVVPSSDEALKEIEKKEVGQ